MSETTYHADGSLLIHKGGARISNLQDWFSLAPPRSPDQWVDGRSAKELARAWLDGVPTEVLTALNSNGYTAHFVADMGEPEKETKFDEYSPGRVHDLVVDGEAKGGKTVLCIEGKADESFGSAYAAAARATARPGSNIPNRVDGLTEAVFGDPSSDVSTIRYQLLYALAGTAVEARERGAVSAVFVVHEFISNKTSDTKHNLNAQDLNRFVSRLTGSTNTTVQAGHVVGPISIPGHGLIPACDRLFIGKATTNLRMG